MTPKQDGWNIILAGIWNRSIFSPDWVGRVLFHDPEVETLISVMPVLPIVYRNAQVSVEVASARLLFRPRELNNDCINAAEVMAFTVLDTLRETPLLGVGVNFSFVEPAPRNDLVQMFGFADNPTLADAHWDIQERTIIRKMQQGDDTLNLVLKFDGQELTVDFNYHTPTTDGHTSRAAVTNRAIRLRDLALQLLDETYQLQLVGGDNDE